jgi:hypothetical protein
LTPTEEVGAKPCATPGGRNVNIDAATKLVLPTAAQRTPKAGILTAVVVIEGTLTFRYTYSTTAPTAAVGLLGTAPTATIPVTLIIRGESLVAAFTVIGTAAGDTMSYDFYWGDTA